MVYYKIRMRNDENENYLVTGMVRHDVNMF